MHIGQDFAFDDDLGVGGHFEIGDPAAGEPIRLAEQAADDFVFSHVRRIGVNHRAHVVQRMDPERNGGRERLSALLGAAMEFVQAPA